MREIRFRAWRMDEKYMVTSDRGVLTALRHCYGNKGLAEQAGFSNIDNQPNPDRFILMQYTGLKDKNGKEIYEGDIVATPYVTPVGDLTNEIDEKLVVGFEHGRFVLIGGIEPQSITRWCESEEGEYVSNYGNVTILYDETLLNVIGNIYENPELLKGA